MFVIQWSGAKQPRSIFAKLADAWKLPGVWTRRRSESKRSQWLTGRVQVPVNDKCYQQFVDPSALNSEQVSAELARQEIDLLIVCGAPILRKRIFELPKIATINVHFGLCSAYRGQHTIFWPLLERQFDKVGATVHLIDQGVNTGQVLIEHCPAIVSVDHEFSLDLKMGNGLVDPVLEMLEALDESGGRSLTGQTQTRTGKQIVDRDRGIWNSLRFELQRLVGRMRLPELPERVTRHYRIR